MPEGEVKGSPPDLSPIEPPKIPVSYDGTAGQVAGIAATNGALTLVTLGVYRFWAKTRLRRYFWSHVSIGGDRLEYTGLGKELFIGFLLAVLVFIPMIAVDATLQYVLGEDSPWRALWTFVFLILIWFLVNFAIYRARRYRLARTRWRGIRFGQSGEATRYALKAMAWQLLVAITFGIAWAFYRVAIQDYKVNNTWFGSERFHFSGSGSELIGPWFIGVLLALPTLGFSLLWYRVREFNYLNSRITATGFRCRVAMSTGRLIMIFLPYLLILGVVIAALFAVLTTLAPGILGLLSGTLESAEGLEIGGLEVAIVAALAVAFLLLRGILVAAFFHHPTLKAICESTTLFGGEELEAVLQRAESEVTYGEGLADALDVGSF